MSSLRRPRRIYVTMAVPESFVAWIRTRYPELKL